MGKRKEDLGRIGKYTSNDGNTKFEGHPKGGRMSRKTNGGHGSGRREIGTRRAE